LSDEVGRLFAPAEGTSCSQNAMISRVLRNLSSKFAVSFCDISQAPRVQRGSEGLYHRSELSVEPLSRRFHDVNTICKADRTLGFQETFSEFTTDAGTTRNT